MYQTSSQRKFWTYRNEQELAELRAQHNQKFIERFGIDMDVSRTWMTFKLSTIDFPFNLFIFIVAGQHHCAIFSYTGRGKSFAETVRTAFERILQTIRAPNAQIGGGDCIPLL
jgi:hypothetical protein